MEVPMPNKHERSGLGDFFISKANEFKKELMDIQDISLETDHLLFSLNDDEWYRLPCTKEQIIKKQLYFDWEEIHNMYVKLAVGRDVADANEYKERKIREFHLSDENLKDYVINNQDLWQRM